MRNEGELGASDCRSEFVDFRRGTWSGIDGVRTSCAAVDETEGSCGRSDLPILSQLVGITCSILAKAERGDMNESMNFWPRMAHWVSYACRQRRTNYYGILFHSLVSFEQIRQILNLLLSLQDIVNRCE